LEESIATFPYGMTGGIAAVAIGAPHFNFQYPSGDTDRFPRLASTSVFVFVLVKEINTYSFMPPNKVEIKTTINMT
jgi:hypothetical protein